MSIHCKTFIFNGKSKGAALLLLSLIAICLSCTKEQMQEDGKEYPIGWDVATMDESSNDPYGTKALIDGYLDLRSACSVLETHEAEKIGVFGSCTLEGNTTTAFDDVDLWWWNKEDGNPYSDKTDTESKWNYLGEDVYWVNEADYVFKAYFPKSQVKLQPGSGSSKLLAVYDSETSQYDLLVAHKEIKARAENPVVLMFSHALAALKINFQFINEGVSDSMTECWLENVQTNGLYTSCTLNFTDTVYWPVSTSTPVGTPMYYWKPVDPLPITSTETATAYSSSAAEANGQAYTGNNGWLLVIPQVIGPETVQLCFKTKTGGDEVYRAALPATELQPGKRYTYLVKISSTQIELKLAIADWNERDSSYEIDFNK